MHMFSNRDPGILLKMLNHLSELSADQFGIDTNWAPAQLLGLTDCGICWGMFHSVSWDKQMEKRAEAIYQ